MSRSAIIDSVLKDELPLGYWLAIGALVQAVLSRLSPAYAPLVPIGYISYRFTRFVLTWTGLRRNERQAGVRWGKVSALVPLVGEHMEKDTAAAADVATTDTDRSALTVFMVGFESHHPLGRLAPGVRTMLAHIAAVWDTAEEHRAEHGYLGRTDPLLGTAHQSNGLYVISYWRSPEHLAAFARSPAHSEALRWWYREANKTGRYKHIGIMHETWHCEAGAWEDVYGNFRPFGMVQTQYPTSNAPQPGIRGPVILSQGDRIADMRARMG